MLVYQRVMVNKRWWMFFGYPQRWGFLIISWFWIFFFPSYQVRVSPILWKLVLPPLLPVAKLPMTLSLGLVTPTLRQITWIDWQLKSRLGKCHSECREIRDICQVELLLVIARMYFFCWQQIWFEQQTSGDSTGGLVSGRVPCNEKTQKQAMHDLEDPEYEAMENHHF
jgi:hypothetical protein